MAMSIARVMVFPRPHAHPARRTESLMTEAGFKVGVMCCVSYWLGSLVQMLYFNRLIRKKYTRNPEEDSNG